MATVQSLIESATVASTANDPGKLAGDAELIVVLNRVYQAYSAMMALSHPDRWVTSAALSWTGTPATVTLATDAIDIRHIENALGAEVAIVPVEDKGRSWVQVPAVYRRGASLVSLNRGGDPVNGESGTLWYLDAPAALTALANSTDARWPVRHEPLLAHELALYLAMKDVGRPEEDRKAARQARDASLAIFRAEFALTPEMTASPHGRKQEAV